MLQVMPQSRKKMEEKKKKNDLINCFWFPTAKITRMYQPELPEISINFCLFQPKWPCGAKVNSTAFLAFKPFLWLQRRSQILFHSSFFSSSFFFFRVCRPRPCPTQLSMILALLLIGKWTNFINFCQKYGPCLMSEFRLCLFSEWIGRICFNKLKWFRSLTAQEDSEGPVQTA